MNKMDPRWHTRKSNFIRELSANYQRHLTEDARWFLGTNVHARLYFLSNQVCRPLEIAKARTVREMRNEVD